MSPILTRGSRWRHFRNTDPAFDVRLLATVQHGGHVWVIVAGLDEDREPEVYRAREFATVFDKVFEP